MVVRHGEKLSTLGCLNATGQARAEAFVRIFSGSDTVEHDDEMVSEEENRFPKPSALFANFYDDPIDCERCLQTLSPLSEAIGVSIDHTHGYRLKDGGNKGAALAMKAAVAAGHKVVLTAWEHFNIQFITHFLGVAKDAIPKWPEEDYDSVYLFHFDGNGTLVNFQVSKEGLVLPLGDDSILQSMV
jgi:hypothetical protein